MARMHDVLAGEPLLQAEYVAVVESASLEPIAEIARHQAARALIAVRAGSTRLLDNIELAVP
jgi:pantothenate synthetase